MDNFTYATAINDAEGPLTAEDFNETMMKTLRSKFAPSNPPTMVIFDSFAPHIDRIRPLAAAEGIDLYLQSEIEARRVQA